MTKRKATERDMENLLEQKLSEKGYAYDIGDENRDVYMQKPRTNEEKKNLNGLSPDYLVYLGKHSNKADIVIEVKKPNMKLGKTLEQALSYARLLGSEIVILFDGINLKSFYVEDASPLTLDGVLVDDILPRDSYKLFLDKKTSSVSTTSEIEIKSKQDLVLVFDYANKKLRKAGIQKGIERFTEFSNLLFLKLVSESEGIIDEVIPDHVKWDSFKMKDGQDLLSYINDTVIPTFEKMFNQNKQNTIFSKLLISDPTALKEIINKLDGLKLSKIQTDIKGDAFEYFIQKYNSTNKDLGEYFTPRHIVDFLISIARPKFGESVYDPFCGTGGMIIAVFNHVYNNMSKDKTLNKETLDLLRKKCLFGAEISSTAKIAKMNMILTGDGHTNVTQHNTLKNPVNKSYDLVVTNIPFNLHVESADCYYTVDNSDGNSQCVEHIIKSLKRNGESRALVIVPEGFLNNPASKSTRKFIVDNNLLCGIISLPSGVFKPYTSTKTSILHLQGFNREKVENIYYFSIENDGYTLTDRRRKVPGVNDIDEFLSNETARYENPIKLNEICENTSYSFLHFKYNKNVPDGCLSLSEIIEETKIENTDGNPTQTVTASEFYGIVAGEHYWDNNFASVTSKNNLNYKVLEQYHFAYNPSRINVGSIGINLTGRKLSVSSAYVTFRVNNEFFLPEYVYLYLRGERAMADIKTKCFGSVRQALRITDLKEVHIPAISKEEQKDICNSARNKHRRFTKAKIDVDSYCILDEISKLHP